jgi:site-specific DNA-methyltransferase (adenine-specific)
MELYNNDCLYQMTLLKNASVDLVFCDLPYGETSCAWDSKIDLEAFWVEINRITKPTTPIFFTTTTRYGAELIASNPKNFRYDLVWVKSASAGFLLAKKMPMRKHEMVYVFYKKLPLYNLDSHKHKFLDTMNNMDKSDGCYGNKVKSVRHKQYDPPLPNSVLKEDLNKIYGNVSIKEYPDTKEGKRAKDTPVYDPPLPNSILEISSQKGKHATQKPVELLKWILKYYSKENDLVLDPTMGSGTTGVACKLMNRKFIGIEKNEAIYKTAVKRIDDTIAPMPLKDIVDIAGNIIHSSSSLVSINEDVSPNTHIG